MVILTPAPISLTPFGGLKESEEYESDASVHDLQFGYLYE